MSVLPELVRCGHANLCDLIPANIDKLEMQMANTVYVNIGKYCMDWLQVDSTDCFLCTLCGHYAAMIDFGELPGHNTNETVQVNLIYKVFLRWFTLQNVRNTFENGRSHPTGDHRSLRCKSHQVTLPLCPEARLGQYNFQLNVQLAI